MTDQPSPCRTTQHCANHGFCHRCDPQLADAARHLVAAINEAGIDSSRSGSAYAYLAAGIRDAARQAAGQPATQQQTEPHLWEVDHPYYCEEGNYFKNGQHTLFDSWAEFAETTFHSGDRDLNLLIRWDWKSHRRSSDPLLQDDEAEDELLLFFVLQRKAWLRSVGIRVTDDDEPIVRKWLSGCAATLRAVWEPLADEAAQ